MYFFSLQKSVRKMKLTRFYLRRNLEPLGSVCICVGSLPVGLDTSKYKTLIGDVLGESEFCFLCLSDASKQVSLIYERLMNIIMLCVLSPPLTSRHVHSAMLRLTTSRQPNSLRIKICRGRFVVVLIFFIGFHFTVCM